MRIGRLMTISAVLLLVGLLSGCLSHFGILPEPPPPPFALILDIGPGSTAPGAIKVTCNATYSASTGYGWDANGRPQDGRDRGGDDPLTGDFCFHKTLLVFHIDVPEDGWYDVTVISGDQTDTQTQETITIEDVDRITDSASKGDFVKGTWPVEVLDRQITIRVSGTNTVRLNAIEVVQRTGPPSA